MRCGPEAQQYIKATTGWFKSRGADYRKGISGPIVVEKSLNGSANPSPDAIVSGVFAGGQNGSKTPF